MLSVLLSLSCAFQHRRNSSIYHIVRLKLRRGVPDGRNRITRVRKGNIVAHLGSAGSPVLLLKIAIRHLRILIWSTASLATLVRSRPQPNNHRHNSANARQLKNHLHIASRRRQGFWRRLTATDLHIRCCRSACPCIRRLEGLGLVVVNGPNSRVLEAKDRLLTTHQAHHRLPQRPTAEHRFLL